MEEFVVTKLDKLFEVDGIFTVHYFEYGKNYEFEGEQHNFWEAVYADKGGIEIFTDDKWKPLEKGHITFHRPMQFHSLRANGRVAPNVAVFTFECNSKAISFFDNKIYKVNEEEKQLIGKIIANAKKAFTTILDDPYTKSLTKRGDIASEQLMGLDLEELLILLYQRNSVSKDTAMLAKRRDMSTAVKALQYMDENICEQLCVGDIAQAVMKSESELKRAFKMETGISVMTYFRDMKINYAKQMLREQEKNITETAEYLGYKNIHHFSKQFKMITGMSPSEYINSIKSRLDR